MYKTIWLGLVFLLLVPPQRGCFDAEGHQGKLHVAVIGDRYDATEQAKFDANFATVKAAILSAEPYASNADIIEFLPVFNIQSLNCQYSPTMARLLTCPTSTVTARVNALGIEYDHIIVIVDSSTYGGSGGSVSVTYNGSQLGGVILHEWGHTFGGLLDEYLLSSSNGSVQNRLYANCDLGLTTPPPGTWVSGCNHPNWKRQKAVKADGTKVDSVMRALTYKLHNEVSKQRIQQRLDQYRHSA